jgi:two-component system response regulator GlrR
LQPRLLRLIEQGDLRPAGTGRLRRVNVRIIAATAGNLQQEVSRGLFRADLYYQLAVTCVRLPALRERREDIPLLCRSLLTELSERDGVQYELGERELQRLVLRGWPGNVRELRNAVERIAVYGWQEAEPEAEPPPPPASEPLRPFHEAKAEVVANFERDYLRTILEQKSGNITAAAAAAGVDRVHFLRLLDRYGFRKNARGPAASPISV